MNLGKKTQINSINAKKVKELPQEIDYAYYVLAICSLWDELLKINPIVKRRQYRTFRFIIFLGKKTIA